MSCETSITLSVTNNTDSTQKISILGNSNLRDTANATTEYKWDVTGLFFIESVVTLEYKVNGAASFTTYSATIPTANIDGLLAALNQLGIGNFYSYTSGGNTYVATYNDRYTFGDLNVLQGLEFEWSFTNTTTKTIDIIGSGLSGTIYWGDGTTSSLSSGSNVHVYSVIGTYTVNMVYNGTITTLNLSSEGVDTFIPINLPNSIAVLSLSNNNLTEFNPTIALPSGLTNLLLINNNLTEFNPTIALPSGLSQLTLSGNQLTNFAPTNTLPVTLTSLTLVNNLSIAEVNNTLIYLDNIGYSSLIGNLQQIPSAPPSGAGLAAKLALNARGCSILTD